MAPSLDSDRMTGALLGLAVGDALGAPLEFARPPDARKAVEHGLEMTGGGQWEPGEWTDDTAMALCLADSILAHGLLDLDDVAGRYVAWAGSRPKDIGMTTRSALEGASSAHDARDRARRLHEAGGKTAGNGTVMRAAPIGLMAPSAPAASGHARDDAVLTHFDPAAGAASAALCTALHAVLTGRDPLAAAGAELGDHARLQEAVGAVLAHDDAAIADLAGGPELGTCWATLGVSLHALEAIDDYERGVAWAISLGGDTDTNAAVVGALLGCRHGVGAIPPRWLESLRERDRIERVARLLAERRAA